MTIGKIRKGSAALLIHTVRRGDTVFSVAREYGVPPARVITDNLLTEPGRLAVGQDLLIQYPTVTHTVAGGDTLTAIAARYGVSRLALLRFNPVLDGDSRIYPGQVLNVAYEPPEYGEAVTMGYAYPFIDRTVLRRTLPYLTYLSVFSTGLRPDASLIPPESEAELIALAREYAAVPLLTLTSLTEGGTFSSELVAQILASPALTERLAENLAEAAAVSGYGGVDSDFEYIPPEYASAYAGFLETLGARLPEGIPVFVSLAPKVRADQGGLLYEGHSYPLLGAAADGALLMTYEWGYTFGPPMAVAPIREVRRVVDYAVREIEPKKLLLGLPNYGYDWTLPYVAGESRAESLGNVAAVRRAADRGAAIRFDETAQSPTYGYYDRPETYEDAAGHVVWFENARSVREKLLLGAEYGLGGFGVWNVMRYFPALWTLVNRMFRIRKSG